MDSLVNGGFSNNYSLANGSGTGDITIASQSISGFPTTLSKNTASPAYNPGATASSGLTVAYASSDSSVATVSGSTITIAGLGTTTITASQAGNSNYNPASSLTQTLTVTAAYTGTGQFTKISSDAALTDGYYVIAAGTTFAMNNTNTGSIFGNTAISPASNVITNPATSIVWKIETNATGRTIFNEATSKYVSYTGSSNLAFAVDSVTGNSERWAMSWQTSVFFVSNLAASPTRYLEYNSSSPRFACYTGTQTDLTLYRMTPVITTSGVLAAVNTTYGAASLTPTSFTVSGASMNAGILVTPPTGFEVSQTVGGASGYADTLTVGTSGTIQATAVYVRLKASASVSGSPFSGNVTLSSSGATVATVATVASTVSTKALTITGLTANNKTYDGSATATLSGTPAYVGLVNSESFSVSGTASATFADATAGLGKPVTVTGYTAPSGNYTVTQPSGLTADIAKATPTITLAPSATSLVFGQTLSSSTLSGGSASAAGTFAFTTPSIAPAIGTSSQGVTFTPTDTANYETITTSVSVTVISVYASWASGFPGFTDTASGSDPDNDQKSNLLEFAFGTDPTVSSSGFITYANGVISANGQPTTSITNVTNGVDYRAVFGRRKDYVNAGLTYTVQFSAGLDVWVDSTATPVVLASDANMEAVSVPYPLFIATSRGVEKPTFFRVAVSGN